MAKEEQDAAAEEPQGGSKKTIIIFAAVVLVAVGASIAGTMMFLGGSDAEHPDAAAAAPDKPRAAIYHGLRPAFIVNYNTGTKPRLLQADLTIMARDPSVIEALVEHSPLVRSHILNYLTDQDFFVLQTHEGKENLREGLRALLDDLLSEQARVSGVESVLLTNFVMQ